MKQRMEVSFSLKVRIKAWKEESTLLVMGSRGRKQNKVCSDQTVKQGGDFPAVLWDVIPQG